MKAQTGNLEAPPPTHLIGQLRKNAFWLEMGPVRHYYDFALTTVAVVNKKIMLPATTIPTISHILFIVCFVLFSFFCSIQQILDNEEA